MILQYGTITPIDFMLQTAGTTNFLAGHAFATGEVQISIDGGAPQNTAVPTHVARGHYTFNLTAAQTTGKRGLITIIDASGTKAWDDTALEFRTAGNLSAYYPFNLFASDVVVGQNNDKENYDLAADQSSVTVGTVNAIAANAITDTALNTDLDLYLATIRVADDNANSLDRWVVTWEKNGIPLTTGITLPVLTVKNAATGAILVSAVAMTDPSADGSLYYGASGASRIVSGIPYVATATATIEAATRTDRDTILRDSQ